ncbi:MAG: hypothetical protein ACK5Q7_03475 [Cyanobacteriota bacterium]
MTSLNNRITSAPLLALACWMAQANVFGVLTSPQRLEVTSKVAAATGNVNNAREASAAGKSVVRFDIKQISSVDESRIYPWILMK